MDYIDLLDVVKTGEDSKNQFKERINSPDSLAAEICAFTNSDGGKLYVGISDEGDILGLSPEEVGRLNQDISNACSQKIKPPVSVRTTNIRAGEKIVVVIDVPRGVNKFYMANNTNDVWIKVGADKRRASRDEIRNLLQEGKQLYADEDIVNGTGLIDIDLEKFEDFFLRRTGSPLSSLDLPIEVILNNLKLMQDGECTIAGLLLFGKKPEQKTSKSVVKAVSFYGDDPATTQYRDSRDLEGSLERLFSDGMSFFKNQLKMRQERQGFNSLGILEIPEVALEEALLNALLHRNYYTPSQIRLFVFDNRVEIISPGGLPNTVNVESIKLGIHIERNPILVSIIKDIEGIPYRGIGTGIQRILNNCADAGVKVDLNDDEMTHQFKITFWRKKD